VCDIPSGLQATSTTWELALSVPTSASHTLEPWLEFHRLILSAPPKRENKTTRSLSGQQAFLRRRLDDGKRILARELNEFDIIIFSCEREQVWHYLVEIGYEGRSIARDNLICMHLRIVYVLYELGRRHM